MALEAVSASAASIDAKRTCLAMWAARADWEGKVASHPSCVQTKGLPPRRRPSPAARAPMSHTWHHQPHSKRPIKWQPCCAIDARARRKRLTATYRSFLWTRSMCTWREALEQKLLSQPGTSQITCRRHDPCSRGGDATVRTREPLCAVCSVAEQVDRQAAA